MSTPPVNPFSSTPSYSQFPGLPEQKIDVSPELPTVSDQTSSDQIQIQSHASAVARKRIVADVIREVVGDTPFVINAAKVDRIKNLTGISNEELLKELIPFAKPFARPFISNYQVGVVGMGKSGCIYLGVNLEFLGVPLNQTVHAEQFLLVNARNNEESEIVMMALSAAPCGYCRQSINEIGAESKEIKLVIPERPPQTLPTLLPDAFGPVDLGMEGGLLTPSLNTSPASPVEGEDILFSVIRAARNSYAPYTGCVSGVSIGTKDGKIYNGSYIENAAFNPSLSPLQTALVALVADKKTYTEIDKVVLGEYTDARISHRVITEEILKSLAPAVNLTVFDLKQE